MVVGTLPGFIGIVAGDAGRYLGSLWSQVFLVNDSNNAFNRLLFYGIAEDP